MPATETEVDGVQSQRPEKEIGISIALPCCISFYEESGITKIATAVLKRGTSRKRRN